MAWTCWTWVFPSLTVIMASKVLCTRHPEVGTCLHATPAWKGAAKQRQGRQGGCSNVCDARGLASTQHGSFQRSRGCGPGCGGRTGRGGACCSGDHLYKHNGWMGGGSQGHGAVLHSTTTFRAPCGQRPKQWHFGTKMKVGGSCGWGTWGKVAPCP